MTNGAILLIALIFVAITDAFMAVRFRSLADQADEVGAAQTRMDPARARRVASFLFAFAALLVIVAPLIAFGIIPVGGIDPIKL